MTTALLKFTQGSLVGAVGQALFGAVGTPVTASNVDNTGVASWQIDLVYVDSASSVVVAVPYAYSNSGSVPQATWLPDVPGGYRLVLYVWSVVNRVGTPDDMDIRVFGVKGASGFFTPPSQIWPLPLPDPRTLAPNAKPNELNFGGNAYGYAGSGADGLLNSFIKAYSYGVGGVTNFIGRVGAIAAVPGDYTASQVVNTSATVAGTYVSDALDTLEAAILGTVSGVASFKGRVGAVAPALSDYAASLITNNSATVSGATVAAALDALKASITSLVTGVASFKTRTGNVTPAAGDYAASLVTNDSTVPSSATVADALNTLRALIAGIVSGVSSFNLRTGAVAPTAGDYAATQVTNNSATVTGAHVSDALDALKALIVALVTGVSSFKTRTGNVVPVAGDYAASLVTNDSATVSGSSVAAALDTLKAAVSALVTGVASFKTRTGNVAPAAGDYEASLVTNDSSVPGSFVKDALNALGSALATSSVPVVADIPARNALTPYTGLLVYVTKTSCFYAYSSSGTWHIISNSDLGYQAAWYIDADAGSDNNDGKTSGTAINTLLEWQNRCNPNGQQLVIHQDVTVNLLSAAARSDLLWNLNIGTDVDDATYVAYFYVYGPVQSSAPMTLTGVTQAVATAGSQVRGQITVASGTLVNRQRIRVTTGAAAGAMTYSMGLIGGDPTKTYIGYFSNGNTDTQPSVGDQVVVDTILWSVSRVETTAHSRTIVQIHDLAITQAVMLGSPEARSDSGGGGNTKFFGCIMASGDGCWASACGGGELHNCVVPPTAKIALLGSNWLIVNQHIQGILGIAGTANDAYGLFIDGGNLEIGVDGDFNHPAGGPAGIHIFEATETGPDIGGIQAENGPGRAGAGVAAVTVRSRSSLTNDSYHSAMWGLSGGYLYGFQVDIEGSIVVYNDPFLDCLTRFLSIAATNAFLVGGHAYASYSPTPIYLQGGGGILVGYSFGEGDASNSAISTYLTAQTAAISSTQLLNVNGPPGLYRVRGYLTPTTVGAAGALTLQVTYTDDTGASHTSTVCSIDNATASGAGGEIMIVKAAGSTLYWQVIGYTAGLTYTVRIAAELDSQGCN